MNGVKSLIDLGCYFLCNGGREWIVDFRLIIDDCISPQRTMGLTIDAPVPSAGATGPRLRDLRFASTGMDFQDILFAFSIP